MHWSQPGEKKLTGGHNWQNKTMSTTQWGPAPMAPQPMPLQQVVRNSSSMCISEMWKKRCQNKSAEGRKFLPRLAGHSTVGREKILHFFQMTYMSDTSLQVQQVEGCLACVLPACLPACMCEMLFVLYLSFKWMLHFYIKSQQKHVKMARACENVHISIVSWKVREDLLLNFEHVEENASSFWSGLFSRHDLQDESVCMTELLGKRQTPLVASLFKTKPKSFSSCFAVMLLFASCLCLYMKKKEG